MKAEKDKNHILSSNDKNVLRSEHGIDQKGEFVSITNIAKILPNLCDISNLIQILGKK